MLVKNSVQNKIKKNTIFGTDGYQQGCKTSEFIEFVIMLSHRTHNCCK